MNVIFMGTPDFSVPVLKGLIASKEHTVTAVVTQPDKARGRSGKLVFTPVKEVAVENNIPVYTPARVKDAEFVEQLRKIPCDVIVVVAFGQILSKEILDYPKYGCINVHASLLPRWRGAAPMQWAILEGDEKTGVTTMQMAEGLDTGDMLLKAETVIEKEDTGEIAPQKQDDSLSCYAKMLKKDMGKIDMNWDAAKVERYIRGMNSWPSAYAEFRGKTLKLWRANVLPWNTGHKPGMVVDVLKNSFIVQTGDGCLELLEVQLEGKRRMDAGSFLRGVKIEKGDCLC